MAAVEEYIEGEEYADEEYDSGEEGEGVYEEAEGDANLLAEEEGVEDYASEEDQGDDEIDAEEGERGAMRGAGERWGPACPSPSPAARPAPPLRPQTLA
jgi:hypothetical protein